MKYFISSFLNYDFSKSNCPMIILLKKKQTADLLVSSKTKCTLNPNTRFLPVCPLKIYTGGSIKPFITVTVPQQNNSNIK